MKLNSINEIAFVVKLNNLFNKRNMVWIKFSECQSVAFIYKNIQFHDIQ